jgi:hypothetical protein
MVVIQLGKLNDMNWNQKITSETVAKLKKRKTLNFILTAINT